MAYIGKQPTKVPLTSEDIVDESIESADIKEGTIVNSDINAAAGIVTSKVTGAVTSITSHGLATSATTDTTNADNIGSGTLPDARFPATLPAASGANLTALPAANLTGTVASARLGSGTANSTTILYGDGSYKAEPVSAPYMSWQAVVTAATFTAVAGRGYPINTTSNACTVTLPASASVGDTIKFVDYARNWGTNAVTLNTNSLKFQGNTSPNPIYNTSGQSVTLTYVDVTQGWLPTVDDDATLETPQTYSIDYLVVAGGGGGGGGDNAGGGAGAGGYRNSYNSEASGGGGSSETTIVTAAAQALTVTIGAGGAGGSKNTHGYNGNNSVFSTVTSTAGGGGGSRDYLVGNAGGSGGGSCGRNSVSAGGAGTANQGYAGGPTLSSYSGSGGGGAGAVGATPAANNTTSGAPGGAGLNSSITGSAVGRGGGGGGAQDSGTATGTATHGGGAGATSASGAAATVNTGGGGGGGGAGVDSFVNGGAGGSGVVILRMLTANYSTTTTGSPTVTTSGSDTILTFTGSGSYTT